MGAADWCWCWKSARGGDLPRNDQAHVRKVQSRAAKPLIQAQNHAGSSSCSFAMCETHPDGRGRWSGHCPCPIYTSSGVLGGSVCKTFFPLVIEVWISPMLPARLKPVPSSLCSCNICLV